MHWWNRRAVAAERLRIIALIVRRRDDLRSADSARALALLEREIMSGLTVEEIEGLTTEDERARLYGLRR
jgi:hypothetical protein